MNHTVLLADDSLTIQKVIKITLAQQPYDIVECSSEEELFRKLPDYDAKLVFLDFNLSEKHTGYELTSKIKSISPNTKVLLLLGTFDSVDESAMEKCGASDKIVKPFDSNKFISVCRQLIDSFVTDEDLEYPETPVREERPHVANPEDQWTMNHTVEVNEIAAIEDRPLDDSFPKTMNALDQGLSDWSMSIPGVINNPTPDTDRGMDLPPIISEAKSTPAPSKPKDEAPKADVKFPVSDDLDYPDFGSGQHEPQDLPKSAPEIATRKPSYVSLSELNQVELDPADATGEFQITQDFLPEDSNVKNIEAQIADEVETDLWHVDEFEDLKREVSAKIDEVKNNFQPTRNDFDDSLFGEPSQSEAIKWADNSQSFSATQPMFSSTEMKTEMEAMVKKYVQEYMDQMFQKNVEKVSWEVIPDLAENLIRQELSKIANKILSEK
jgi:CheY-like chemotaxis protein